MLSNYLESNLVYNKVQYKKTGRNAKPIQKSIPIIERKDGIANKGKKPKSKISDK